MSVIQPVVFLSHGGGPLPLLGDKSHLEMLDVFASLKGRLTKPAAILLVSAHWEEPQFTLTATASPGLVFDYYGFPPETYQYRYPVPGAPDLALKTKALLQEHGLEAHLELHRGVDHGVFVPMLLLFPDADVPVVQLSLKRGLDAAEHLQLGQALQRLRQQGILLMGSGYTFHNLSAVMGVKTASVVEKCLQFHDWLDIQITDPGLSQSQRFAALTQWQQAPNARFCHPREEHLLPLHFCCAAADGQVAEALHFNMMGLPARCYFWAGAD
ncbi:class III extradiol ring-cleavage dioxygenase [Bowmanella denitrificans]|uniref:Class III extradiol ring-cleavage dioxygenase n=1 Tax=Bowmanella denitrificans TaxID=366582 RepID=A0ABP3GFU1_9ALTE